MNYETSGRGGRGEGGGDVQYSSKRVKKENELRN